MQTHLLHASLVNTAEAELWSRLKRGDEKALSSIYTAYLDKLYNFGIRHLRDSAQLKDCIQDVFVALWNGREGLGDVTSIKPYLYACLRRRIFQLRAKLAMQDTLDAFPLALSHKSHYLNQQIDKEVQQQVIQVLNCLGNQQREAIFLIYYEEVSYKDAADIMGLKIRSVYNLVYSALLRLRAHKKELTITF